MKKVGGILVALLLLACMAPGAPSGPSAPSGRRVEPPITWVIGGVLEPAPHGRELWVYPGQVSEVDASHVPHRLLTLTGGHIAASDKAGGANGFLVTPLQPVLAAWPHGTAPFAVVFEANVPYRTVTEILYTAGQSAFTSALLLVLDEGRTGGIRIEMPSVHDEPRAAEGALALTVTITRAGVVVSSAGGRFAPGCAEVGDGQVVTVPARQPEGWEINLSQLDACLRRLKEAHASEDGALIVAEPDAAFSLLARVMITVQGTPASRLFPTLTLGVTP